MPRDPDGKKRSRNDECWCGSGKKFKQCHLNRDSSQRVHPAQAVKLLERAYAKSYCSCPDDQRHECSGSIVRAHTISQAGSLALIAEEGHVVKLAPDLRELAFKSIYREPLIGVNKASTFTGFCGFHDGALFRLIDDPAVVWDRKAAFLLCYRTLCRERFTKQCAGEFLDVASDLDQGMAPYGQLQVQASVSFSQANTRAANRSGERLKKRYDDLLSSPNLEGFEHITLQFKGTPQIAISGGFEPDVDLDGVRIQDPYNFSIDPELLTLNVLPSKDGTIVSIVWTADRRDICRSFAEALTADGRLGAFIFMGVANSENAFVRPSIWAGLPSHETQLVRKLVQCFENPSRSSLRNEWNWLVQKFPNQGVRIGL